MSETMQLNIQIESQKAQGNLDRMHKTVKETKKELASFGPAFQNSFSSALDTLEGQLQSFVMGGKFSFQELGQSALKELGKIGYQLAIKPILGAFGNLFSQGGVMTSRGPASLPVHSYSQGGVATRPQMAIFGEGSGPEAFVPLKNNKIPVQIQTPMQKTSPNLQVITQVHLHPGSQDQQDTRQSDSSALNQLSERIRSLVVSELLEQSREGGILYQLQNS